MRTIINFTSFGLKLLECMQVSYKLSWCKLPICVTEELTTESNKSARELPWHNDASAFEDAGFAFFARSLTKVSNSFSIIKNLLGQNRIAVLSSALWPACLLIRSPLQIFSRLIHQNDLPIETIYGNSQVAMPGIPYIKWELTRLNWD